MKLEKIVAGFLFLTISTGINKSVAANIEDSEKTYQLNDSTSKDTLVINHSDSILQTFNKPINLKLSKEDSLIVDKTQHIKKNFVPDPQRALWLSLVIPGAGQIYNRKYWKLPIFYGGFIGCTYAFLWNQQMYGDYSQAYLDIMDSDPSTQSYVDILPPTYDISSNEDRLKSIFKDKKDYYRRYRDLSAFCFAGVYLLSVIDAYVDAELSVFDISPDLSIQFSPAVIKNRNTFDNPSSSVGIQCGLKF